MTIFVRCKVSPGIFDREYLVEVHGSSAFVARHNVRGLQSVPATGKEVDGEVMAYLVRESENQALIELAGEVVAGGLRAWVPSDSFVAA